MDNVYLIVGVHSDKDCEKHKRKPIFSHEERCESVRNCNLADEIVENSPIGVTKKFIDEYRIDIIIHGDDKFNDLDPQYSIPLELGIMRYIPYTKGISTSEIIERIKRN